MLLFGREPGKFLRLFFGGFLCLLFCLDLGKPFLFCLLFFLNAKSLNVLCKLYFVIVPLLLAALSELFTVGFFRFGVHLLLLLGGAHFGLYPHFAARFDIRTLACTDDLLLSFKRLLNADETQENGGDHARDDLKPDKEKGDDIDRALGLGDAHCKGAVDRSVIVSDGQLREPAVGSKDRLGLFKGARIDGRDVPARIQAGIENGHSYADEDDADRRIDGHCQAVASESCLPFEMIEGIGEERHEDISAGQTADILDKLPCKHDDHVGRRQPTDERTQRIENEARNGDVFLTKLLGKRPHGKDTDTHGHAADDVDERLRDAVIIGA